MGVYKVLLLLNECGDPPFLFQNLHSYKINNQKVMFDKTTLSRCVPELRAKGKAFRLCYYQNYAYLPFHKEFRT